MKRAVYENEMAAGLDPEEMKIVRRQDQQLNMAVEVPVIAGLFAAMGDGQGGEGFVISDDPLFKYDNHQIHYEMHPRFIMDGELRFLHPEIQAAINLGRIQVNPKYLLAYLGVDVLIHTTGSNYSFCEWRLPSRLKAGA